ncbi:MAG: GNAT family N-acetyltransferase [Beijerinckiaceae bacterium]
MTPVIETERLRLREWREDDLDAIAALWADEDTARYIGGVKSRDDAWRSLAMQVGHWKLRGYGMFAIEEKDTGAFVGWSGPYFPEGWPEPEIGWTLRREFRGRGYATEATRASRDYAYRALGWTTAISLIDPENFASLRVAERLGARRDGTFNLRGMEVDVHRHPSPRELN